MWKPMNLVIVRNVKIGNGIPKVCVPIIGSTRDEIISQAKSLELISPDIVEWRADWFEDVLDTDKTVAITEALRKILGETPLLFTFRTLKEGGEKTIDSRAYTELNIKVSKAGMIDLIDVEAFTGDDIVENIICEAHKSGVKVIVSNHDFKNTPDKKELISRLCKMQDLGADISKIAVMPKTKADVLILLAATQEMSEQYARQPIVTMSMGNMGSVTRMVGEIFGSAITFGAAKKLSAPGQIEVQELRQALVMMHHAFSGDKDSI